MSCPFASKDTSQEPPSDHPPVNQQGKGKKRLKRTLKSMVFVAAILLGVYLYQKHEKEQRKTRIAHCFINGPFHEEIHKYNFFPEFKKFNDTYYGKFEVIHREMSVPLNVTFMNADWEELEVVNIQNFTSEQIADVLRNKGYVEAEDAYKFRREQEQNMPKVFEDTKNQIKDLLKKKDIKGLKEYDDMIYMMGTTADEF